MRLCKCILIRSCGFLSIGIFPAEEAVVDFSTQRTLHDRAIIAHAGNKIPVV